MKVVIVYLYSLTSPPPTHTQQELEEENKRISQEKEDLESEVLSSTTLSTESEVTSLKKMKREMESKVEELEDELDEANAKYVIGLSKCLTQFKHLPGL